MSRALIRRSVLCGLAACMLLALPLQAQEADQPASVPATESPSGEATPTDLTQDVGITPGQDEVDPRVADQFTLNEEPAELDTETTAPVADPAAAASPDVSLPAIPSSTLPHDLSPWGMFMQADVVVKAVMIGLAFAALVTWTVWLAKMLELAGASSRARAALKAITGSKSLDDAIRSLDAKRGVGVLLVKAAEEEVQLSYGALNHADSTGLKERVSSRLSRLNAAAGRRISRGTGLLATIGSTAPFVGLFGTVWGIMNAFIGISEAQTTNLAVVAPGIAEALLATALGLVAAIPAVIIYNVFSRSITGYRQLLADAAAGVERLVSRDLDWRLVPAPTGSLRAPARPAASPEAQ